MKIKIIFNRQFCSGVEICSTSWQRKLHERGCALAIEASMRLR